MPTRLLEGRLDLLLRPSRRAFLYALRALLTALLALLAAILLGLKNRTGLQ